MGIYVNNDYELFGRYDTSINCFGMSGMSLDKSINFPFGLEIKIEYWSPKERKGIRLTVRANNNLYLTIGDIIRETRNLFPGMIEYERLSKRRPHDEYWTLDVNPVS